VDNPTGDLSKSESDVWVDILKLMIRHGASIETKTLRQGLKMLTGSSESSKPFVSTIQRHFREWKVGEPDSSFSLAEPGSYNTLMTEYKQRTRKRTFGLGRNFL